ncbi:MFS transporter [Longimycelium tulufanense]|uniref:MFS transporter n=1 Tax=Longimycelium tulufanense TaxID=907463 RepID=A0A8J3FV15_9PSEU|nr:MFS transporter [Longimycelium tulufanense]GGM48029.1 MFS transporter [Longimycelium tulufanense]
MITASRAPTRVGAGRWVALAALGLATLVIAVDATVLGLAVPHLTEELGPSNTELLWIGDIYSFVLAGLLVTMGTVGDRIGRKRLLLVGSTGFGLASLLAAYAPMPALLIAARALLGVAGATLMPSTLSLIRNIFPDDRERVVAVGLWGAMATGGAALGPLVGGALLERFWWGSVFLINVPVMAVVVLVGAFVLPESKDPNPGRWDMPSVGLSMVGMVAVVYAIKETAHGGLSIGVLLAVMAGIACLMGFASRQLRLARPMIDVRLFANPRFSGAVLANGLSIAGLAGIAFFMSQFFQIVQGSGPLGAGLRELPLSIVAMIAGVLAGAAAARTSVRAVVVGGTAWSGVALAAIVGLRIDTPYPWIALILLVIGAGAGLAMTLTANLVLSAVPKEKAGAASAVSETAYELGAALGIAVLGSVLAGTYRSSLELPPGTPQDAVGAVSDSLANAARVAHQIGGEMGEAVLSAARNAFVEGMQVTGLVSGVVLLIAATATHFLLGGRENARRIRGRRELPPVGGLLAPDGR